MKQWIPLALALGALPLAACEAKQAEQEGQAEAAQGKVVSLAVSGMT